MNFRFDRDPNEKQKQNQIKNFDIIVNNVNLTRPRVTKRDKCVAGYICEEFSRLG